MSQENELLSAVGVDYSPLRDLLVAGQWQKADEETGAIMLKIARRVTGGSLREEDIQEFPCQDLKTIAKLWLKYSQGLQLLGILRTANNPTNISRAQQTIWIKAVRFITETISGCFGFSVQSRIWSSVESDYAKFSDRVEWRLYASWQHWRKYPDLTFSQKAPEGHLPAAPFFKSDGLPIGWAASLKPKLLDEGKT